jgi:hypothetical protein
MMTCNLQLEIFKAISANFQCNIQTFRMINVSATALDHYVARIAVPAYEFILTYSPVN